MGKGKKKGQKGGDAGEKGDVPSVASLSISEDAPSTSQTAEEEEDGLGLGVGSRKKNRKQKQAEAKAAATTTKEASVPQDKPEELKVDQLKVEQPKVEQPKVEQPKVEQPKVEQPKVEQPKVEQPQPTQEPEGAESGGLGLGGGGKKRPRKKKSLAAAEVETKAQGPSPAGSLQPVPEQPVQIGPPGLAQGPPQGIQAPGPWAARGPSVTPGTPAPAQPGYGRGAVPVSAQASQWQSAPPVAQAITPSVAMQSAQSPITTPSSSSTSLVEKKRFTPARELSCRFSIPPKVLGRSVRTTPTRVITNYLPMLFKPIKVYRYDVIIKPDKPKKMIPAAFKQAIKKQYPNDPYIAFDQVKNCYTLAPLKDVLSNSSERHIIKVELKDPNGRVMPFDVSFKATGVVDLAKLKQHMDAGGSSLTTPSEEIQCVDVILRQGALEAYVKCGRQFFRRPANPINLTGGLEMWTGLFQSAIFTSHAFINIDVVHKGFPVHQSMLDAIMGSFRLGTDRRIEDQRSREVENFISFVKGLRVVATLVGPPNHGQTREFICNGLVDIPSKLSFTCERDGKKTVMTVAEYFLKEKGYKIKYPYLNCMWVGPRDKNIYYPMELLQVSYGQARNRQLNEFQLSNMVKEAAAPPLERKRKIEELAKNMSYSTNAYFKKFGLEISPKFLEVDAKILAPPSLDCGERQLVQPRKGQWQSNRLVKPEALVSWGFIAIDCNPQASNYETIRELLMSTGRPMGMEVAEPIIKLFNVRVEELRNHLFAASEKKIRLLFIIVGTRGRDTYHRVKQMAERDVGILTQCIKEYTASRRMNLATMKNILLKVNSKLMGVNQVLDSRTMPNCLKGGDVMIVGADVTHPSPEQTSVPSIAAVTASMDAKCFAYNIELSVQTPKKEMIVEFCDMMYDHLKLWREKHHALPRKIYVYRDGVSEGQFAEILNSELTAVHKAYQRFNVPNKPEVLFLLVQKRHHTRFFTSPRCDNVEPGTVVDTHIVHPKELDFYLVSHQAIKGTARPTRYHAICNDGNIPHDEVEQLTYYLCHLYSRCMRSVSYPTPTYYAHLACFRARSLTFGQKFDNAALEKKPERLRVLDKMLQYSRMFFV